MAEIISTLKARSEAFVVAGKQLVKQMCGIVDAILASFPQCRSLWIGYIFQDGHAFEDF